MVLGIAEREHGGLKVTHMPNGSLLVLIHSYGSMVNVSILHQRFAPKLMLTPSQRVQERASFGMVLFRIPIVRVHKLILLSCSAIIEDTRALQKSGLASLAFFYCDFREDQKKDVRGLLSSLLVQLGGQSNIYSATLSNFYAAHGRGSQHASDDELLECLKDMLKCPSQATVHIIIDALDECPVTTGFPSPREKVLDLVEELVNLHLPNLRICVTSRPEADIAPVLEPLASCSVSLHGETGQVQDIAEYVKSAVHTNREMKRWKATDKQLVIDVLIKKADGM